MPAIADAQPRWHMGIRGGYNIASANFRDRLRPLFIRTRNRYGVQVGILNRYYFPIKDEELEVAIQIEVLYSEKGYVQLFRDEDPPFAEYTDYLEIPMVTHISYLLGEYTVFGEVGFFYERLLEVAQEFPEEVPEGYEIHPFRYGTDRRTGFGVRLGMGIGRRLLGGKLELGLVYSQGLLDYLMGNRLLDDTPFEGRLYAASFGAVYIVPLGFPLK